MTCDAPSSSLLPAEWDVPLDFRLRLGDEAGRQRAMTADGHLLVVLHAPPGADATVREGRLFWRSPEGAWRGVGAAASRTTVGDLLDEFERDIEKLQQTEDAAKSARDYFDLLNRLNPLARSTRNLHRALQDAREAMPEDRQLLLWRDRAYGLVRSVELLHEEANNALDFAVAQRAEEEVEANRRIATASHRLNVMAACFLPVATLSAIFGMNLHHGFELWDQQSAPWPTLAVLIAGLALGVLLSLFITRKP